MPLLKKIVRALASAPKTWVAGGGGSKHEYFTERKRTAKQLEKYRIIYDQGGIVTEAINSYPMFISANGYRLEGPEPEIEKVQDFLDSTDFNTVLWDGITDTLVYGDAFQEIVPNVDQTINRIIPRLASEFEMHYDGHGEIADYVQKTTLNGKPKEATLEPDQILHLQFWRSSGSMYGHSLLHRAYDDIIRDTKTAESTAEAIKRHGYRKYHIRVGQEGEHVEEAVLKLVSKEFSDLNAKNDFTTTRDTEIRSIDEGGLEKVDVYTDIFLMRLASAMGVPEEMLGLRRGSTDATATKRIETFYKKITALQYVVARCYNLNIIDRITRQPGTVKLVFNPVNPDDELKHAKWMAMIMKATPADPFAVLPREWIQEQFSIKATPEKKKAPEVEL